MEKLTSLSAGLILRDMLLQSPYIAARATAVYPLICDEAHLPYIVYRRTALEHDPVKQSAGRPCDVAEIEVLVFAQTYEQSVKLAEEARAALDGKQATKGPLTLRACHLADSQEQWSAGAFIQQLIFDVRC